jgi:hypothetical protein
VRTLAIAILLSVATPGCGDDGQTPAAPEASKPDPEPAAPAPGEPVRPMTPTEVKKEVDRAGKEHSDKIDQALDVE